MNTISKAKIKFVKSLQIKKYRIKHGAYVVAGHRIALDLLDQGVEPLHMIVDDTLDIDASWPVTDTAPTHIMKQLTSWTTPSPMLLVLKLPNPVGVEGFDLDQPLTLYLDGVQDPGNVGNILRSIVWFGGKQVVIGPGTADVYGSKVVQAAMGAHQQLTFIHEQVIALRLRYAELFVVGLSMEGVSMRDVDSPVDCPCLLMLGREGPGLSGSARDAAEVMWSIEPSSPGAMESLNVASAAAIALYGLCMH